LIKARNLGQSVKTVKGSRLAIIITVGVCCPIEAAFLVAGTVLNNSVVLLIGNIIASVMLVLLIIITTVVGARVISWTKEHNVILISPSSFFLGFNSLLFRPSLRSSVAFL